MQFSPRSLRRGRSRCRGVCPWHEARFAQPGNSKRIAHRARLCCTGTTFAATVVRGRGRESCGGRGKLQGAAKECHPRNCHANRPRNSGILGLEERARSECDIELNGSLMCVAIRRGTLVRDGGTLCSPDPDRGAGGDRASEKQYRTEKQITDSSLFPFSSSSVTRLALKERRHPPTVRGPVRGRRRNRDSLRSNPCTLGGFWSLREKRVGGDCNARRPTPPRQ